MINFVYIYSSQIDFHEYWIGFNRAIRGVFTDLKLLGEKIKEDYEFTPQLQIEREINHDQLFISIPVTVFNRNQADLFMSHQRTIDTLVCSPHTAEARSEMIEEFRRIYDDNENTLAQIQQFENTYHSDMALQWYTRDSFLYRIINQALRTCNVELMFKMRYFLIDLYVQLMHLCPSNRNFHFTSYSTREQFYRGQSMFQHEFEYFQKIIGQIISINTFLSTTLSLQVASAFANQSDDMISVIFYIEIDRDIRNKRPYGNISNFSSFLDEEEVLFAMGSIFRIESIENDQVPIIHLSLVDQATIFDSSVL